MMAYLPSSFVVDSKTSTPRASCSSSDRSTRCLSIVFCMASVTDYELGSLVPTEIQPCRLVVVHHLVLVDKEPHSSLASAGTPRIPERSSGKLRLIILGRALTVFCSSADLGCTCLLLR